MKPIAKTAATMLVILWVVSSCAAQDKLRRVEQPTKFVYKNTPIEVVVKIDGKEMSEREVQAGSDWLRKVSLEVTNISNKNINWLLINLMLKEPVYGAADRTPESAGIVIPFELPESGPNVKILSPGAKVNIKPPVSAVDYWTKYARERGVEDIEKVILDIAQVRFTDDSHWYRGMLSRKDPETGRMMFVTENSEHSNHRLPASIFVPKVRQVFFWV